MEIDTGRWNTRLKKRSVGFLPFFVFFPSFVEKGIIFFDNFCFLFFVFVFVYIYIYISVAF